MPNLDAVFDLLIFLVSRHYDWHIFPLLSIFFYLSLKEGNSNLIGATMLLIFFEDEFKKMESVSRLGVVPRQNLYGIRYSWYPNYFRMYECTLRTRESKNM